MLFQPKTPFLSVVCHAELAASKQTHREDWVGSKLSRFEPTGLSCLGRQAGKLP